MLKSKLKEVPGQPAIWNLQLCCNKNRSMGFASLLKARNIIHPRTHYQKD